MDTLLSSLTGNAVQGVLTFYDERNPDAEVALEEGTTTGTSATASGTEGKGAKKAKKVSAANKITVLESVDDALAAIEDGALSNLGFSEERISNISRKRVYVQFNPSEISLTAVGGGTAQITNFSKAGDAGNGTSNLVYGGVPPRVEVIVPLIFDEENNCDCFLADKLTLSPTALAKNVASLFSGVHSVQKQVEGFVASCRSDYIRYVTFSWADMCYSGYINQVRASYTMFDNEGNPVRAKVSIRILCLSSDVGEGNVGPWKDAFDAFYGDGSTEVRQRMGQRMSGLLNLG